MDSPLMTLQDVALGLKVDEKTVCRLVQWGEMPGFKVAGTWRFKRQDIDAWIEQQKERAAEKTTRTNRAASLALGRVNDATF